MSVKSFIAVAKDLLVVLCLCSAGCVRYSTLGERDAFFSAYQTSRVGQDSLRHFLIARSAVLLQAHELRVSAGSTNNSHLASLVGTNAWRGNAAAIDRRGFFLTAAHCVQKGILVGVSQGRTIAGSTCTSRLAW